MLTTNAASALAAILRGVMGKRPSIYTLEDRLMSLAVPSLIVVGDRDHWCRRVAEFLARTIPGADLAIVEDAGHLTSLEQPDRFNEIVGRFLDRIRH
jgi:pimeloyl-ACP methyl ester carboxylesterase